MEKKKIKIPPFPLKLYDLVNNENNAKIITWSEDGLSFVIKDIHKFIYEILPKKFDTKLFSSFNRQLNSYGFTKTKSNQYEFSNQFFIETNSRDDDVRVDNNMIVTKTDGRSNFIKYFK
jgi:flavodoxin